jgi:hypothetical protein
LTSYPKREGPFASETKKKIENLADLEAFLVGEGFKFELMHNKEEYNAWNNPSEVVLLLVDILTWVQGLPERNIRGSIQTFVASHHSTWTLNTSETSGF